MFGDESAVSRVATADPGFQAVNQTDLSVLTHRKWHEIWPRTFINYFILLASLLGLVKSMQAVAVDFGFCFVFKRHIKLLLLFIIMIIGAANL